MIASYAPKHDHDKTDQCSDEDCNECREQFIFDVHGPQPAITGQPSQAVLAWQNMQDPPWINLPGRKALVKWRETNQYLCRDVAAKLGLAPETYSKIERGKRRMPEYLRPKAAKVTGGEVPVDAWVWKTERKG